MGRLWQAAFCTESPWQEGSREHTDFGFMPCLGNDYQGSSWFFTIPALLKQQVPKPEWCHVGGSWWFPGDSQAPLAQLHVPYNHWLATKRNQNGLRTEVVPLVQRTHFQTPVIWERCLRLVEVDTRSITSVLLVSKFTPRCLSFPGIFVLLETLELVTSDVLPHWQHLVWSSWLPWSFFPPCGWCSLHWPTGHRSSLCSELWSCYLLLIPKAGWHHLPVIPTPFLIFGHVSGG